MKKSTSHTIKTINIEEPKGIRYLLISSAIIFLSLFLIIPLFAVFFNAIKDGISMYISSISAESTLAAIRLTFYIIVVTVPLNIIFGLSTAWAITKFEFPGKNILITLIDLPLTVSPVIAGTIFILLFGAQGILGEWLMRHDIKIVFALPGIILATLFVTLPYIARELIPLMQSLGNDDEETALSLGASGWQTFLKITLPNIKWGLLYGIILSTARAIGEFGAVSVVSGHIRDKTVTAPLHVEILYNEYNFVAAFSVASLLVCISLVTIGLKKFIEHKNQKLVNENIQFLSEKESFINENSYIKYQ